MKTNLLDKLSFLSLFLVAVLLPLFCLPFTNIPIEVSKGLLLVVGLTFCIIFWSISRLLDGKIVFPKSWITVAGFGIVLVSLLSALFSSGMHVSLFGTMFDIGSFYFIFSGFVLMFFSSIVFRTPKRASMLLFGVIASSILLLIFQGIRLFSPSFFNFLPQTVLVLLSKILDFLSPIFNLGLLAGKNSNIFGSWSALGLFAGFSVLALLLLVEFFQISKKMKIFSKVFIFLFLLMGAAVNMYLVWILVGIFSLAIFVYKTSILSQKNTEMESSGKKYFPMTSFVVTLVSLMFLVSGQFVTSAIPNALKVSNDDVSPFLSTTLSITKDVVAKHPLLGIGPNRFNEAWSMYKPIGVNATPFWNTSFDLGSGLIPTFFATTGIMGILAWLAFIGLFLFIGFKSVFSSIKNTINLEMVAFFVLSLFLLLSLVFYGGGTVMFLLTLIFIGVFIGLSSSSRSAEVSMSFLSDPRKSFFSILLLVIIIIVSVTFSFKYGERFVSISYFGKALSAGDVVGAENSISKALSLYSNDLYLRTNSQIAFLKVNSLIKKGATLSDQDKTALQEGVAKALASAQGAVDYNSKNYMNFQLLGSIYQTLGTIGVKDVFSKAVDAYQSASLLNPLNPNIKLSIASVFFLDEKIKDAKDYANAALALKPDYIDAFIVLSQISKKEGNDTEAVSYAEKALSFSPEDKNLIQYVNSLKSPNTPVSAGDKTSNKKGN